MAKINGTVKEEMLEKMNWAVVGVSPNEEKFGFKVFDTLKDHKYIVYGVNPRYDEVKGEKIYHELDQIIDKVECINFVVNPKITYKMIESLEPSEVQYLWFQPGSYDDKVLELGKEKGFNMVHDSCVLVELGKR
ncbi:CoA-binding protein [Isachenkonia alkalipeptolytica]|uniref:CoA-binding protein n=1 Tax=Isachenkonia alkalipeptolytica TaxID=2565777 RepID=A0AA43XMB1_9CLOT|nr:CoA-binding protein [Isachenkonia alkalipeptolytica]NBG88969.1 CoA-binding protein [Isachenkonia alkalipeptolytica]